MKITGAEQVGGLFDLRREAIPDSLLAGCYQGGRPGRRNEAHQRSGDGIITIERPKTWSSSSLPLSLAIVGSISGLVFFGDTLYKHPQRIIPVFAVDLATILVEFM